MRAIRAGLALLLVAGCHTWQERPVTAPDPSTDTGTLRLTTNQGARRVTLERATVRSDSVVGRLVHAADRRGDRWVSDSNIAKGNRAAVAVADIGSLDEQTNSATRTVMLFGFLAAWPLPWRSTPSGGRKAGELSPRPASTEPNRTSLLRAEVPASRIHRTPHRHEARAVPLLQCLVLGRQCGAERSGPPKRTGPVAGASLDAR